MVEQETHKLLVASSTLAPGTTRARFCQGFFFMMLSALALDLHRLLARERWLPAGSGLLIALSGGGDSTALLRLFWELAPLWNFRLQAAHLNHNLRPEAENEAAFARRLCQKLDIPYWLASQPIAYLARSRQLSLEEAGRQARYAFLERLRVGFRNSVSSAAWPSMRWRIYAACRRLLFTVC